MHSTSIWQSRYLSKLFFRLSSWLQQASLGDRRWPAVHIEERNPSGRQMVENLQMGGKRPSNRGTNSRTWFFTGRNAFTISLAFWGGMTMRTHTSFFFALMTFLLIRAISKVDRNEPIIVMLRLARSTIFIIFAECYRNPAQRARLLLLFRSVGHITRWNCLNTQLARHKRGSFIVWWLPSGSEACRTVGSCADCLQYLAVDDTQTVNSN